MSVVILNLLMVFLLFTAFFVVFTEDLLNTIIILFMFSSILVVIYVILQSPGVALAEAVIAAGLTIAFYVITVNHSS
ncbi:MAG: Na(+)/H(+) antiporter subunit B [bacterium]